MPTTIEHGPGFVLVAPRSYPCPFPCLVITVALSRKHESAQLCVNEQVGQRPGVDIRRELRVFLMRCLLWRGLSRFLFSADQHAEDEQDGKHCHSQAGDAGREGMVMTYLIYMAVDGK